MPVRRTLVAFVAISAVTAALGCAPSGSQWRGTPPPRPTLVGAQTLPAVDSTGASTPFAFKAEPGRALLVFFGYVNCPDVCPTTMADLKRARTLLGPEGDHVRIAFASVDLNRDSAAVLVPFVHTFAPDGIALLATRDSELAAAEVAFGATSNVTRGTNGETQVAHTGNTYLVDEHGDVIVIWKFGTKAEDIAEDLRRFLAMARR